MNFFICWLALAESERVWVSWFRWMWDVGLCVLIWLCVCVYIYLLSSVLCVVVWVVVVICWCWCAGAQVGHTSVVVLLIHIQIRYCNWRIFPDSVTLHFLSVSLCFLYLSLSLYLSTSNWLYLCKFVCVRLANNKGTNKIEKKMDCASSQLYNFIAVLDLFLYRPYKTQIIQHNSISM